MIEDRHRIHMLSRDVVCGHAYDSYASLSLEQERAVRWFEKAADAGWDVRQKTALWFGRCSQPKGMYRLGLCLLRGTATRTQLGDDPPLPVSFSQVLFVSVSDIDGVAH
uniref:Uncharacterized protein n=1 Tax=Lotharella globosa TaxID=91324 RepID=A0A7S4DGI8_9EUKA|mmetsp:Transcript_38905/g.74687  ORF Transcript_38905/g.74687 Transcript_38905/m.74687 type:complete len:109 (+) Transcript_38905:93-419(+)